MRLEAFLARPYTQVLRELQGGISPVGVGPLSDASDNIRREVLFSGRVQGVGFRYTVRQMARRFRVTGFVQNLPDGRVLLVAEGAPADVDRFIAAVKEEMADYVHGQQDETRPATGEFADFGVRR